MTTTVKALRDALGQFPDDYTVHVFDFGEGGRIPADLGNGLFEIETPQGDDVPIPIDIMETKA